MRQAHNLAEDDSTNADQAYKVFASRDNQEDDLKLQQWEEFDHTFEPGELELLKQSIAQMALSRIDGQDELFVGG